jgi:hypothetical protein
LQERDCYHKKEIANRQKKSILAVFRSAKSKQKGCSDEKLGAFRLNAIARNEDGWIALSLPRELAAGGYYIRRILSVNLFIMVGIVSLLAGVITVSKEDLPLRDPDNSIFGE